MAIPELCQVPVQASKVQGFRTMCGLQLRLSKSQMFTMQLGSTVKQAEKESFHLGRLGCLEFRVWAGNSWAFKKDPLFWFGV